MIDDKKIESAKEEIYEDRFLLNGEEIVFNNDEKEEMFYKEDIKEAIGLGAKSRNGGVGRLREDIRGICHRPCIYNDKDKCDMWDELSVPDETEECANQIDV